MPWWASLYAALIATFTFAGVYGDARKGSRTIRHLASDVLAGIALLAFMVAYWRPQLLAPMGRWSALVLAITLAWDIYSTKLDIAELESDQDPELTPRENDLANWGGILLGGLIVAPAYALALVTVVRTWRGPL